MKIDLPNHMLPVLKRLGVATSERRKHQSINDFTSLKINDPQHCFRVVKQEHETLGAVVRFLSGAQLTA